MEPKANLLEELQAAKEDLPASNAYLTTHTTIGNAYGLLRRLHEMLDGKADKERVEAKQIMDLLRAGGMPTRYRDEIDATLTQAQLVAKYTNSINPQAVYAEHPAITQNDWSKHVSAGTTLLGYWDFVQESLQGK